jgi:hypothetical protein
MATFQGAYATQDQQGHVLTSDENYYEQDTEPDQIYLESVLPQAYDPTLEPFNTTGLRPKEYPEQNEFGFHPVPAGAYTYTVNNSDPFFTPEQNFMR